MQKKKRPVSLVTVRFWANNPIWVLSELIEARICLDKGNVRLHPYKHAFLFIDEHSDRSQSSSNDERVMV